MVMIAMTLKRITYIMLMIISVARATSVLTEDRPSFYSMLYYYMQMLLFGKYLLDTVLCNGLHVTV